MKIRSYLLSGIASLCLCFSGQAQPDTIQIKKRALVFADSLIKADHFKTWPIYADLAPASVLKHYGGKEGYVEHILAGRKKAVSDLEEEDAPQVSAEQLLTVDEQWQCLIRVSRYIHHEDKKLHVITYFLGQSRDDGQTWKLFDISYNTVANIIYIFPEIFPDMGIPEPSILTEEQELALQKPATPAPSKKKTAGKK
jgi:hypothetical protein